MGYKFNPFTGTLDLAGSGTVSGGASSTDNAIARYDGTTGKLLQNSQVTIDDSGNMLIVANLSSNLAGALTSANWSSSGSGWVSPVAGGILSKNADGTGTMQMNSAITITIGVTYRIDITTANYSVGSVYFDFAGFTISGSPISANGMTTYYLKAFTTSSFFLHPSNTSRFDITAVQIRSVTASTGDVVIDGNLTLRGILKDPQGVNTLFVNSGSLFIVNGGAVKNPTEALTIGNDGSIQIDHGGQLKGKLTDTTTSVSMVYIDNSNIFHFTNEVSSGGAIYGTINASANGDVAIRSKGAYTIFIKNSNGNVGIFGNTSPTAYLHIAAGTASANTAPFKLTSGTNLTTPEVGAIEYDANNFYFTKNTAVRESISGVLFTQTADKTISNTVTETSIIATGVGTMTLPANFFVVGKTLRLRIGGIYSTPAIATPSVVIKVKLGSTVIATVTTSALLSGATNLEFDGEVTITCRSTGGSGTVMVHGDIEYATGVGGTISVDPLNNAGAVTTVDTTASKLLDITITWDTATSTRSVTSTVTLLETLN